MSLQHTAAVIVIGNEILSGRTHDINLPYLGKRFDELGIQLIETRVVRDVPAEIIHAVNHLRKSCKYVFTTGGIGPTHDDITTECIAEAFDVEVEQNAEAVKRLNDRYGVETVTDARLKMANIPVGAALVDNPVSAAPGFRLENVYVFAGVPKIMQAMFEGIANELVGGEPMLTKTISAHMQESQIAASLEQLQNEFPEISIGSYPFYKNERYGVSIVTRSVNSGALEQLEEKLIAMILKLGKEPL